jgi:hypothetical protein
MKRALYFSLLLILLVPVAAEEYISNLVYDQTIFEDAGNNPIIVSDERGWVDIGQADLSNFFRIKTSSHDSTRKWRVVVTYLDENRTGQTTLQIRFRGEGFTTLFTLPWSQINSVPFSEESNWFIAERMAPQSYNSLCSARLISPPGASQPGKIYKITLEAWEFSKKVERETLSYEDTLLASTRVLKPMGQKDLNQVKDEIAEEKNKIDKVEALEFSLDFVEASLYGNLPEFYRMLNDEVHSLSTGNNYSKFVINPPEGVKSRWSLDDYKNDYDYRIYSYDEYTELFPEWISDQRDWTPDSTCYLFMGNSIKENKFAFFSQEDLLVFMVSYDSKNEWSVVAQPEL